MKKIGVFTLNGLDNFGNRLQNYAVQVFLHKKSNYEVTTMWCCDIKTLIKNKIKFSFPFLVLNKRNKNFIMFNKNFITTKFVIGNKVSDKNIDYLIVGSDQVWNPYFGLEKKLSFLKFSPKHKNISFSASIGTNDIPNNLISTYKEGLENIKNISVREESGKKICEKITGRKDIEVLVDPTMLLAREEWDKVSTKPQMLKSEKFILNYFLGNLSESKKGEINRIARKNDCEVINILDKNSPFYECGPSEFLYLEKHAFLICTDSFHSSVFGILYNTPFLVFDRDDKEVCMNSRLETLLKKFKLEGRKYTGKIKNEDLKIDCTEAYKILEEERKKSDKFLRNALDIKDSE